VIDYILRIPEEWKAAELTWMPVGGLLCTQRRFTCPQTVSHPSSNRTRRRTTTLVETNALTTTPNCCHPKHCNCLHTLHRSKFTAASRGFPAAARLSCSFLTTSITISLFHFSFQTVDRTRQEFISLLDFHARLFSFSPSPALFP